MSNTRRAKSTRKPKVEPIDFDKIRTERGLTLGQIPPIRIGGQTFTLPPSLPLSVTDMVAEANDGETTDVTVTLDAMKAILAELFGEDQWAQIRRHIDIADVPMLFTTVFDRYGESVGEASNSGES